MEQAIMAGGCFWCTEAVFRDVVGVSEVESGYIGGETDNPTYRDICTGRTGHAEAVRVTFDPDTISLADSHDVFMCPHAPTRVIRQGNHVGTQYRSAIFPLSEAQFEEAKAAIGRWNTENGKMAVTTIEGFDANTGEAGQQVKPWYPAEDYHQEYWEGEGQRNPYCLAVVPPKLQKLRKSFADKVKQG